ncbi:hypothetical protein J2X16_003625 [Pelomonas aquatica]|uniref:Integrase n=1 Tax=Pelomonas aquatica TaxID=431058 RepID=A0ABU1ZCA9_9BURK|nr:integrase [Pelomonas aquatica]MDR7298262.1 hypothetical protein [Pelomonas aquatica]
MLKTVVARLLHQQTHTTNAFELLAAQPSSLIGLTREERHAIVLTAVVDSVGREHVLSRFGDKEWDFSPEVIAKNKSSAQKRVSWPSKIPGALIDDAKAAVYCALRQGRHGQGYAATSCRAIAMEGIPLLKHLWSLGIKNFSEVRSLHIADYVATVGQTLSPTALSQRLAILDLVWWFSDEMLCPMVSHPFGGRSLNEVARVGEQRDDVVGRTAKTDIIPPTIQKALWEHCEKILAGAEALLDARDRGRLDSSSPQLLAVRDAVLYQIQITSGMRNSESTGVANGCWRSEERVIEPSRRVTLHWVQTREIKTSGGAIMDYLVPGELFRSLEILERFSLPYQRRLAEEALWLEKALDPQVEQAVPLPAGVTIAQAAQRLNHVREIQSHMLLTLSHYASDHLGRGSRVEVMSINACHEALHRLVKASGIEWIIANHQCRRTFAYNVANSRLGRMGLVFIKWQFKHASVAWSQLYAASPRQDQALYEDFGDEIFNSKVELIASWHESDARLSGGAGRKLLQTRGIAVKNMRELLTATADSVDLRSTGHAWCLSGTQGCHGQGVYDATMCGGCSQSIIDESQGAAWKMIYLDSLRLAAIQDCGPAVTLKAKRAVALSAQVLVDLGLPLPAAKQAEAYGDGSWVE